MASGRSCSESASSVLQIWSAFEDDRVDGTHVTRPSEVRELSCSPQLGELSSARQALEGAELASGNEQTLQALRRRPAQFRDPLPDEIVHHTPDSEFKLEEARFGRNLRTARKGAAAGPSGMTSEHLRPLLASSPMLHWLFRLGEHLVTAKVPDQVVEAVRMGRMTALRKPSGGVRGIVVGDVIRRLVARTVAQKVSSNVESATAPYQYALSTRAGCECVSHVVQAMCEANPLTTTVSVNGVSAYDTISREAMMHGLMGMEGGECLLPFVRQFYGRISQYLWDDAEESHPHHLSGRGW